MVESWKEVRFDLYCQTCKYFALVEFEEPCNTCLETGMRDGTEEPECYEQK